MWGIEKFLSFYLFIPKPTANTAINYADVNQLQIEALFHVICTTILLHSQLFTVCKYASECRKMFCYNSVVSALKEGGGKQPKPIDACSKTILWIILWGFFYYRISSV